MFLTPNPIVWDWGVRGEEAKQKKKKKSFIGIAHNVQIYTVNMVLGIQLRGVGWESRTKKMCAINYMKYADGI